jgi:ankyrin repeat protein
MTAAAAGHVDTVRSLLDKPGIDIDAKNHGGATALDFACFKGELEVVKLLVAAGARVNPQARNQWGALGSAAAGGSLQVVKYLLEEAAADVRWAGPDGRTALMVAAGRRHVDVVDYLRGRQGIDIDARTEEGLTALDLACSNGHLEVAKLLVAAGAEVNPQDSYDWGPLVSAAARGHLQVVKYLVEKAGADVRWADSDGKTAVIVAGEEGHVDIVEYLRKRQVNTIQAYGNLTPIIL